MKKLILAVILIGVFLAGISTETTYSQTIMINFDELTIPDKGPIPLDTYTNLGVIFTSFSETWDTAFVWSKPGTPPVSTHPLGGVYSLENAVKGEPNSSRVSVVATFVDPSNPNQPAMTSSVKVVACSGPGADPLSINVALEAYDILGNLIADDQAEDNISHESLSVTAPNIAKVIMVAGARLDIFDNFEFETVTPIECTVDADCDDGGFCNGAETCVANSCEPGIPVVCDDDVDCTNDSCDEVNDICVHEPNDANCDDGLFCNGAETCHPDNDCQFGTPPCNPDTEVCDETNDVCNPIGGCQSNADCDDGEFCNGAETCDAGICVPGTSPCDSVAENCDEDNDVCVPVGPVAKVTICHIPPGNPAKAKTLSIGAAAVPAHLAHGDTLGPCP